MLHNFDSDMTFQLPEPAQFVETRTGDLVYVMLKSEVKDRLTSLGGTSIKSI